MSIYIYTYIYIYIYNKYYRVPRAPGAQPPRAPGLACASSSRARGRARLM